MNIFKWHSEVQQIPDYLGGLHSVFPYFFIHIFCVQALILELRIAAFLSTVLTAGTL